MESFEVEQVELAGYFLGCLVRNRLTNFRFWVLNIYGPAQHELSGDFIQELATFCANEILPIVMGAILTLSEAIMTEIMVKVTPSSWIFSMISLVIFT